MYSVESDVKPQINKYKIFRDMAPGHRTVTWGVQAPQMSVLPLRHSCVRVTLKSDFKVPV